MLPVLESWGSQSFSRLRIGAFVDCRGCLRIKLCRSIVARDHGGDGFQWDHPVSTINLAMLYWK